MRRQCVALLCTTLVFVIGTVGLLGELRSLLKGNQHSRSAHESMRLQMEKARAHAPAVSYPGLHEQHVLTHGRDALSGLGPGDEYLLSTEQLLRILTLSLVDSSDRHELQLLKVAGRLADQKTLPQNLPLSIVKTNTATPFVMVLQARGDHESFLLQYMRGTGQQAYHANLHEPIGAALDHALEHCSSNGTGTDSPSLMIDGGAYFGFFGFQAVAAGCEAVLVEPQRALAPFLAASALLNGAEFAKRVQILRALIAGPALPSTTWPEYFHMVDRRGMSSYAVPAQASAAKPMDAFTIDGLLHLNDVESKFKRPLHAAQDNRVLRLPKVVALKLDIEGLEVAALQGVRRVALEHGKLENIVVEFGPPAHWLRAATGVTQPDSILSPKQRGSTRDHEQTDAIVGDPAVVASLLDEACRTLVEFTGWRAANGSDARNHAYEVRWLTNTPGWRPVVAGEFDLRRKKVHSTASLADAAVEYVVIPSELIDPVMRRLMRNRRSVGVNLWLALIE